MQKSDHGIRRQKLLTLGRLGHCIMIQRGTSAGIEHEEESQPLYAVGLVVEYAPATGETRVRFPDGVVDTTNKRPLF